MKKTKKIFVSAIIALSMSTYIGLPVMAYSDSSDNDIDVIDIVAPFAIPSVVVGSMILASRTKKKSNDVQNYIESVCIEESEDVDLKKHIITKDAIGSNKKNKTSYIDSASAATDIQCVINAGKESLSSKEDSVNG